MVSDINKPTGRNVCKVHDEWFADEEKVRKVVGLPEKSVVEYPNVTEVSNMQLGRFLILFIFT